MATMTTEQTTTTLSIAPTAHDVHELAWVTSGFADIRVAHRTWRLTPSDGLWIPAGQVHSVEVGPDSLVVPAWFDTAGCPLGWTSPRSVAVDTSLRTLLQYVSQASMSRLPLDPGIASRTFGEIAAAARPDGGLPMPSSTAARAVADALLAAPYDDRTIESWAREVFVSGRSLQRSFVADTGLRFSAWRTRVRLDAAIPRLAAGDPVGQVAAAVGYTSTGGFITAFRRRFGSTPAAHFTR